MNLQYNLSANLLDSEYYEINDDSLSYSVNTHNVNNTLINYNFPFKNEMNNCFNYSQNNSFNNQTKIFEIFKLPKIELSSYSTVTEDTEEENRPKRKTTARKLLPDGIMKKIKVNIEMFKLKLLNKILNRQESTYTLTSMSQEFITRVNKEFMRKILNKSLLEVYLEDKSNKHNIELVEKIYGKYEEFDKIMNYKYKDFYEYYKKSHQFQKDLRKIKKNEERHYYDVFRYNAIVFIKYYSCLPKKK